MKTTLYSLLMALLLLHIGSSLQAQDSTRVVKAYPNPFHDSLTLQIDALKGVSAERVLVLIFDYSGEVYTAAYVVDAASGKISISTPTLPCGGYIIRVMSPAGTFDFKVLKT